MSDELEQDRERLEAEVLRLSEHFDSIQIFVTLHEGDGTKHISVGRGNWFARYGHIKEWTKKEEHKQRLEVEFENMPGDEDDDESDKPA